MSEIVKLVPKPKTEAETISEQTPLEFLESFVADVKAGKTTPQHILIFYIDNDGKPVCWFKGVSISTQIAYGALLQQLGLEQWRS